MFDRNITNTLLEWKERKDRKPLVLRGARQVGKTTSVKLFSEYFEQYIYLNLEESEDKQIFERDLPFQELLEAIFFLKDKDKNKPNTLIFIDEIQNVPKAVNTLRYFYEKARHLYVIAAGSLLESLIDRHISFPVGRTEYLLMQPLSFSEFLFASEEMRAIEAINSLPFPEYAHDKLMSLFRTYTLIGGMPGIVENYIANKDLTKLKTVYESLLVSYLDDVEKYARNDTLANVLRHCIRHSFAKAGSRIKMTGFGQSNYRSREISEAMRLLEKALLIELIYPSTDTKTPVIASRKKSPKLQLLDTGLVNYFNGLQREIFGTDELNSIYGGKIAEHIIGQQLKAMSHSLIHNLAFWVREKKSSNAEVDFLYTYDTMVIPIEIKSGATGRLRSLHQFIDRAPHPFAVRFYSGPIKIDNVKTISGKDYMLLNLPFYLVGQLEQYLNWFIK